MAILLRLIVCKTCSTSAMRPQNSKYCEPCSPTGKHIPIEERPIKPCETCAKPLNDECWTPTQLTAKRFCNACADGRKKNYWRNRANNQCNQNEAARQITKFAVRVGFLLHPSMFICMDCEIRQAECYDHRDYSKPLEVDAVCLPCNSSRGRGIPYMGPGLTTTKPKTKHRAAVG